MRMIKSAVFLICFFCGMNGIAQKKAALPHGMVFGNKPKGIAPVPAEKIETFMGRKIRQTTAIRGKVINVTKEKGGWFLIDAGKGKTIEAHFTNYNVTLPKAMAGRTVIIEGVAQRQLIADDLQHFAGDTVTGSKQHKIKVNPKQRITFEVRGLVVEK